MSIRSIGVAVAFGIVGVLCSQQAAAQSFKEIFDTVKKGTDAVKAVDQVLGQPGAPQQGAEPGQPVVNPLSKRDIVEMVVAGVTPGVIVAAIQKRKCAFSVEASEIVELKQLGVDETVITAMIDNAVSVAPGSVVQNYARVSFIPPPGTTVAWSVRRSDGTLVCTLPCVSEVSSGVGMYVQKDATEAADVVKYDLPAKFAHGSDTDLEMEVVEKKGSPGLGMALTLIGVPVAVIGGILWICSAALPEETMRIPGMAATLGGLALAVPGIIVLSVSSDGRLVERAAPIAPVAPAPPAAAATSSLTLRLGFGFIAGTF